MDNSNMESIYNFWYGTSFGMCYLVMLLSILFRSVAWARASLLTFAFSGLSVFHIAIQYGIKEYYVVMALIIIVSLFALLLVFWINPIDNYRKLNELASSDYEVYISKMKSPNFLDIIQTAGIGILFIAGLYPINILTDASYKYVFKPLVAIMI